MPHCPSSKTVLIIDDQPSLLQMVRFALQMTGLQIIEAVDGIDGLKQLNRHSVDLVISDWKMPNMDGLELLQVMRRTKGLEALPFVMISCENDLIAKREAMAYGALSWVKKPFRLKEIQAAVKAALEGSSLSGSFAESRSTERRYA